MAGAQAGDAIAGGPVFATGIDFVTLQQTLGPVMGDPIEEEHGAPGLGGCDDQQQRTSTGLAYVQCGGGLSTFVADPDGLYHWAWLGDRVAAWIGSQLDPPDIALDLPVCLGPAHDPETACPLRMNVPVAGFLREPGQTDAYRFTVANPQIDVVANLTDLPADYDLYLVDGSGSIRAQSTQEGTAPEQVEQVLPAGTYYLYVHVDVGRDPDPSHAYTLRLSQTSLPALEPPTTPGAGGPHLS